MNREAKLYQNSLLILFSTKEKTLIWILNRELVWANTVKINLLEAWIEQQLSEEFPNPRTRVGDLLDMKEDWEQVGFRVTTSMSTTVWPQMISPRISRELQGLSRRSHHITVSQISTPPKTQETQYTEITCKRAQVE